MHTAMQAVPLQPVLALGATVHGQSASSKSFCFCDCKAQVMSDNIMERIPLSQVLLSNDYLFVQPETASYCFHQTPIYRISNFSPSEAQLAEHLSPVPL